MAYRRVSKTHSHSNLRDTLVSIRLLFNDGDSKKGSQQTEQTANLNPALKFEYYYSMEFQHPVLQEMLQLGCPDRIKVMLAFQAYMKLCEVDKLWNVEFLYNRELDIIYISTSDTKEQVLHIPVAAHQHLTPALLHTMNLTLLTAHPHASINILLKTPDSSLLPYKITEGLTLPPNPELTKEKRAVQEKVQYVHSELNKRKLEFYEEAKRKKHEKEEDSTGSEKCMSEIVKDELSVNS
ncbi:uncharacterized protein LOC124371543 [Homalodisca vitripennis]|uniref:uncharacterized protein LOC124371543 n=1 Tax=Homalodisca vitripennis TaxID=197043 RepID=UPI001EEA13DC|nr:uncharacterized protein LOC124371543 [Homalodisca vitripennis]